MQHLAHFGLVSLIIFQPTNMKRFSPFKRPIQGKPFYRWYNYSTFSSTVRKFFHWNSALYSIWLSKWKDFTERWFFWTMGVGDRYNTVDRTGCRQSPEVHHTASVGNFQRNSHIRIWKVLEWEKSHYEGLALWIQPYQLTIYVRRKKEEAGIDMCIISVGTKSGAAACIKMMVQVSTNAFK